MKHYLVAILILACGQMAYAQSNAAIQTSLPLQFNTGNPAPYGMPSTTIVIQGKTLPILLDTGAMKSEIVLSQHALQNITVKYTGKNSCFDAADGRHCEKEFIVPEITLGSFTIKNVKGALMPGLWDSRHKKGFQATEASRDGVIGLALLSKFNLLLDYLHAKAVLVQPNAMPKDYAISTWIKVPFSGHLLTHLLLNGRPMTLGWDTGAIPSIIKQSATQGFKQIPCPGNAPYAKKGCLSIATNSLATKDGKELPNTWFLIRDVPAVAPFDGLLGSNFFSENQVYFDFVKHLIYIKHVNAMS